MSVNWGNVTFTVTAASVLAYYINSLYLEYNENNDSDDSSHHHQQQQFKNQGGARRGGKQQGKRPGNQELKEKKEINELFQEGQIAMENENFPQAIVIFERIEEISDNYPSVKASALSNLFKVSTAINNSDLTIKYAKKIIEFLGEPEKPEEVVEALKFNEILVDRLVAVGRISEAANTIKSIIKKYKLTDAQYVEQYSILSTIYQSHMDITSTKELLDTINKFISYARKTKDHKLQINSYFDLFSYYAMVGDLNGIQEAQDKIENLLPQTSFGYFKSTSDILLKYERYQLFITQRQRLIDFITENPSEISLDLVARENLLNNFKNDIANAHAELQEYEKAKEILTGIVNSEYLGYSPKTKSKYFSIEKAKSKNGFLRLTLLTKSHDMEAKEIVATVEIPEPQPEHEKISSSQPIDNNYLKFKLEVPDLTPQTSSLVRFDLYKDQNKTELVHSFYQAICPQTPQNPIQEQ